MKVDVFISLKNGVLDPQGRAIETTLQHMGFDQVSEVRQGKWITFDLDESDRAQAEVKVQEICEKLLANGVIERFHFEMKDA
jgi:phosphoribosylformylglycinamidine synthase PurS subunit